MAPLYPCPCCGYLTFPRFGSYDVCPICNWEDDIAQLRFPDVVGANRVSLISAQRNYAQFGVSNESAKSRVRPALPTDARDAAWRPIDLAVDEFEHLGGRRTP